MFGTEFYIIGESLTDGVVVGKGKYNFDDMSDKERVWTAQFEVTDEFQRVLSLEDYAEYDALKPVLTMYKLLHENESTMRAPNKLIKAMNGYNDTLNIVSIVSQYMMGGFAMNMLFIPVETE
jgi:hypothetical protein